MNSKKAITLLIMATMILSLVPILGANAISVTSTDAAGTNYYGDTIAVWGSGATPGRDVKIYWDGIDDLLNTTEAEGNGDWEIWFDVPEALNGEHYITVENVYNGDINTYSTAIDVGASIELDPDSGLENDEVTIEGYGFGDEEAIIEVRFNGSIIETSPSDPETNDLGSWTATFDVPSDIGGTWEVYAEDNATNTAVADFKIGASITLNKDEGPSGTVVRVTGRGFTDDAYINGSAIVTYEGVQCGFVKDARVKSNGEFTVDIVIPDVHEDEGVIYVEEYLGASVWAEADFEQTGRSAIELDPTYGPVGSTITVMGYNFTQVSGEEVELSLEGDSPKTVEVNSNGEFTATYRIPGASGTPRVWANQTDYNIDAGEPFRVGFITVVIYPESAVAGEEVTVSGSGFEDSVNVTLDGEEWIDYIAAGGGGVINEMNWVPSMEPGVYEVVVTEESGIAVTVELTVTENTYVELSPAIAPPGYGVDIEGYNFAQNPVDETLEFLLYNDTDEWVLDVEFDGSIVDLESGQNDDDDWDDGYFEGNWTVPDDDEISVGSYWLNVTCGDGMYTQIMFEVVEKTVDIEPKKTVFRVGETVGFNVESSFKQKDSYIKVWDPTGNLYWQTDAFIDDVWVEVGTIQRVPYYSQVAGGNPMTLLEDAPLGTWEWTWYASDDDDNDELDAGTFTVEEAAADVIGEQVADLNNQITDLASQLDGVTEDFNDVKSDIADVAAIAEQAVTAAQQAAEAVETVAQTANTASQAASDAAEAANAARDAANGLTTLVYGAIGAALVAALAAIVSLMQISRRIAG
jgi:hypothetical protein